MRLKASQRKVYQEQDRILLALKKVKPFPFILSGGTALSRFYLHHRFSEDLDFFSEGLTFSFQEVEKIMVPLRQEGFFCEWVGQTDLPGRLKAASCLATGDSPIKIDFLEDPFSGMWKSVTKASDSGITFRVDSIDMIYYRKFYSLMEQWHQKSRPRRFKDLVDLFYLHRSHRTIEKTLALYRKERVPILEEKIILILDSITKKEIREGLRDLRLPAEEGILLKVFRQCVDNLVKEGLSS